MYMYVYINVNTIFFVCSCVSYGNIEVSRSIASKLFFVSNEI